MKTVESEVGAVLAGSISEITRRSIFRRLGHVARLPIHQLGSEDRTTIQTEIESSVRLFAPSRSAELIAACARLLRLTHDVHALEPAALPQPAQYPPHGGRTVKKLPIAAEKDIAAARLEAWSEAVRLGLSKFASVKVATAVSELARNIVFYAGNGTVELRGIRDAAGTRLEIRASDQGPGIAPDQLETIWNGTYRSDRGMGKGLVAVQRLVDDFHLDSQPGKGTTVTCVFRGGK